jgi:repressor LexA
MNYQSCRGASHSVMHRLYAGSGYSHHYIGSQLNELDRPSQYGVTNGYIMRPIDLKRVREQLGLTQQQLADALQTTRVSVARYEAGMRRIPGMVQVAIGQLSRSREIPMAGMVAAGSPIEAVPQSELIEVPPSMLRGGNTFALRVKGESMKDEGILPGDLVVVRKQETARNGQIVVALVNQEATIKTYFKKDTQVELHPANTTMQPIIVRPSDAFQIEGILIGVIRHCLVS